MNRYGWFESCNLQLMMYRTQGLITLQSGCRWVDSV